MTKITFDLSTYNGRVGFIIDKVGAPTAQKLLDYNKTKIYRYRKDATFMNFPDVAKIALHAGVDLDWVYSGKGEPNSSGDSDESDCLQVPFLAGDDVPPVFFSKPFLESVLNIKVPSAALVRVNDDSMLDLYKQGDIVLIDAEQTGSDGVYALKINSNLTIKRLQYQPDGSLKIISENTAYDDHILTVEEHQNLEIAGKVVWHGGE